jgi:HEAT repeat protein
LAALLTDANVREAARCALERIPTSKAVRALENALEAGPEDFRAAVANSLRVRGHKVAGYPTQKLIPTKQTAVEAK